MTETLAALRERASELGLPISGPRHGLKARIARRLQHEYRVALVSEMQNMLGCSLHEWRRLTIANNFISLHDSHARLPGHGHGSFFEYHSCYRCDDGMKPCVCGGLHRCHFPHARND